MVTRNPVPLDIRFESLSVVLPVMTETALLDRTIAILESACRGDILEYILVVCDRTAAESRAACEGQVERLEGRARLLEQRRPFLGGAMQDAFEAARGSHVVMMASDMETPPDRLEVMIAEARARPGAVVTGSRWIEGGGFEGYSS